MAKKILISALQWTNACFSTRYNTTERRKNYKTAPYCYYAWLEAYESILIFIFIFSSELCLIVFKILNKYRYLGGGKIFQEYEIVCEANKAQNRVCGVKISHRATPLKAETLAALICVKKNWFGISITALKNVANIFYKEK